MKVKKLKKELNRKFKKVLTRWSIMAIIILLIILFSGQLFSKKQIMNELDYEITLNEDGSVTIVETWDIYISHTNTLFRTFEKSNKFGDIINVNVKDLDAGKDLTQIYREMYHVTTGCFYALDLNSREFEVAWGTGMENKMGTKRYQFSYTITDVVTSYKDCQEFYWKLLDESNQIPVKKVTGTIRMPSEVNDIDNLKAWGHGPLNGNIEIDSNNKIGFIIDKLSKNKMLEVRVITIEDQFIVTPEKERNYRYLESIINEETEWSEESNNKFLIFWIIVIVIYASMVIINICKAIKYYKITKRKDDGIIYRKLKYFRDIPRQETATPGEATYLYYFKKSNIYMQGKQANIVSATILNLALKGYIRLRAEGEEVFIKIIKDSEGLNKDELAVFNILKDTGKESEFKINEINKFAKKEYSKYSTYINNLINESRENLYKLKLVDKAQQKEYKKSEYAANKFMLLRGTIEFILIVFLIGLIPLFSKAYIAVFGIGFVPQFITILLVLFPIILSLLIKFKMCEKTQSKIAVLTQAGTEEREKWKALAKYMEEFSMIDEKEVPSLVLWEKYLVYATAFGIADKAIEQMKAKYPEVFVEEYWQDENIEKYQVINFATNNIVHNISDRTTIDIISETTTKAYRTSLSEISRHNSSSGSGGGGGFSGGGGGRWWRRPEWDGR
ncbi:MAG: DUF2207 domain-containing protein [Clostridia bacterium]|nr:DUF2207 domain-containing protein [Clostridia bacterium]